MMRKVFLIVMSALIVAGCNGCAFMFKGLAGDGRQTIHVQSVPSQADVSTDGMFRGATPTDVPMPRGHNSTIVVTKDGFQEGDVVLRRRADVPWFLWDIATCVVPVTLCIPVLFDAISSAWMTYDDDELTVKLKPADVHRAVDQLGTPSELVQPVPPVPQQY
jgi:hypothetical protein